MPVTGVGHDLVKALAKIDGEINLKSVDGCNVDDLLDKRIEIMKQLEIAGQAMLARS